MFFVVVSSPPLSVLVCITGDSVYLDDEDKLEEYVLSQDGLIYVINLALPWIFGQVTL